MKNADGVLQVIRCFIADYEKQKLHPLNPLLKGKVRIPRPLFLEGRVKIHPKLLCEGKLL